LKKRLRRNRGREEREDLRTTAEGAHVGELNGLQIGCATREMQGRELGRERNGEQKGREMRRQRKCAEGGGDERGAQMCRYEESAARPGKSQIRE